MKKYLFTILILIIYSVSSFPQSLESGAFGAPVFKYSKFVGQSALIAGVKAGWIINKRIVLGAGYYVLSSDVNSGFTDTHYSQNLLLDFNYGGLEFEYLLLYESKFNITVDMLLGSGGLSFHLKDINKGYSNRNLLVWEPGLNFETTIYEWLHADAGISYRMISSYIPVYDISKNDLEGMNFLLTLKFGSY